MTTPFQDPTFAREYEKSLEGSYGKGLAPYHTKVKTLLDLVTWGPFDNVIDIGCGTGLSTRSILERTSGTVTGVDTSEAMLEVAMRKSELAQAIFLSESVENLAEHLRGFNKAVAIDVMAYLQNPAQAFRAIHDALAPRGVFLYTARIPPGERTFYDAVTREFEILLTRSAGRPVRVPPPEEFKVRFTGEALEHFARETGFEQEHCHEEPYLAPRDVREAYLEAMKNNPTVRTLPAKKRAEWNNLMGVLRKNTVERATFPTLHSQIAYVMLRKK